MEFIEEFCDDFRSAAPTGQNSTNCLAQSNDISVAVAKNRRHSRTQADTGRFPGRFQVLWNLISVGEYRVALPTSWM